MPRNEGKEIFAQEKVASPLGYDVVEQSLTAGETELSDQFRWIADRLTPERLSERTPADRKRLRQEMSKHIKELSDVVRTKHIQHHLEFWCVDDFDECVWKRREEKRSTYLCYLALYICLARSTTGLLAAIAAAAVSPR